MMYGIIKSRIPHVLAGIALAVGTLFLLMNYVAAAVEVQGNSMNPELKDLEKIIILKLPVSRYQIDRFDVIVFSHPLHPGRQVIKRVIGLPGEWLEIRDGSIWIDGRPVRPSFHQSSSPPDHLVGHTVEPVQIPLNCFFVLGDNRVSSLDSRDFGPIHINAIIGRAVFRYWPFSRIGRIS